ncbi:TerB N-terminal domain-containing protein [Luteimonas sp. 22616]|uniref:tellurite resistance TerB family protein n=1 Tax=Luteimonas sp. 22616 TaxID=3453951 RepID=UPI003F864C6D
MPKVPSGFGDGRWVPPGESIQVAGVTLPGGMIYVGGRLRAPSGITDPCLISGQLNVASVGNYRSRQMGYWPNYADASTNERRAYLNWLSEGRSHPDCDIGYVFLFFYGLERRVIVDSRDDPAAKNDWPAIIAELRRLLSIYGEKSGSFKRYAGELLSWIELDGASSQLYKKPVPEFPKTYELPPYLRLALGQAAIDRAPLPAHLAFAWVRLNPETYLRTAATRCPDEFERLFILRYHEVLGPGLVLPKNRTKLKFVYQAASAGLHGANITLAFGNVPDVTALTAPIKKLVEVANQCTDELGSYSRLVGKDPSAAGGLEGLLLLPATLWPPATQTKLQTLTARMREGRLSLPLQELLETLGGAKQSVNRDRVRGLARALEGAEIGFEPHVLAGARAPGERDTVVLFAQPLMDAAVGSGAEYQTAALTLQLAAAMAQADDDFNEHEIVHLRAEIEGWAHLTPAERRRLHAHLQWLTASPPTLAGLKKKLEPLPISAREMLAAFMATLAQSDGFVSPDEVKFLEKVYRALGVEPKRVFSDIHAVGAGGAPVSTTHAEKQGFRLDADRIAVLQEDTARVSALLSKIFADEAAGAPAPPPAAAPEPEREDEASSPLGLDEVHSALLRLMLSRPKWTRSELEDAAADLDLMLDGALEQINEAVFDVFDEPLCEGDDPVAVNIKLLEKIET